MPNHKHHHSRNVRFPWRGGNSVELLVDGDQYFPAMLSAIGQATKSVMLEMYLFESGAVANEFIAILCGAAERSVEVKVLLDGFGSLKLLDADRRRMIDAGIELRFYNPLHYKKLQKNIARDHRKILIVDDQIAFVGGAGITDEFDPPLEHKKMWRETMSRIRGPVIGDWRQLFDRVWTESGHKKNEAPVPAATPSATGQMRARVTVSRGRLIRHLYHSLLRRINQSDQQLWICTAYFQPSRRLRRAIRRAAARNIDVRLLLPGPETDHPRVRIAGRRFYTRLLKAGVRIFEFQDRVLHSKVVLCDDWVSIGSSNFDGWNLRWNLEANQEVEDREFCAKTREMFENDFRQSIEVGHDAWLARPWQDRLGEWFWGWVEFWVTRLGGRNWSD
ncbi:MAG: phospholipase D-like domain-containing protein [Acidiferrobacterales bacterium]